MDKISAKRLVRETLQNPFNKGDFLYLIKNILNKFKEETGVSRGNAIPEDFRDSIKILERLGVYKDANGRSVDVLIVYLKKDTLLERARTKLRNFVAKYLKAGGTSKEAALVAFVSPCNEDWRFSFVKMDYKFRKNKVEEVFTPAKRYSFLVGINENSHTAQSRLLKLLLNDDDYPMLEDLEEAFSIEQVTKEFFEIYRGLFLRVKDAIDNLISKNVRLKNEFILSNINTSDFSKKLLGQIVFLYFLQKKGWFGVEEDKKWGSGSKSFLRELFNKEKIQYNNFFEDVLQPLFYKALREKRKDDYFKPFECRIPFLNGGLFDPINNYDWKNIEIPLPNELFCNDVQTKDGDIGDGILDVFDRYNFTVKEDEPLEKEVAVDPEMLGQVFENLLEVTDRKSKGTYYTPREIVHYMCQESLTNYLFEELKENVSKDDLEKFIQYGDLIVEHELRVFENGRETETYSFILPESIRSNAKLIDKKLATIRICDPAVGSGAFPVGMMNEIVRARVALSPYLGIKREQNRSKLKREAIQNCLYGVDIDPGAVEIAKLRLWLSLVVEEKQTAKIEPLPNLDYKIVQGNSLLNIEKNLFNNNQILLLEDLKSEYFNETNPSDKRRLKRKIDKILSIVTNNYNEFDFRVYFSEIFRLRKGFDIVIANPPYLKERDNKQLFLDIAKTDWGKMWHQGKMDFWYFFLHKAIDITNPCGVISFITSRYWLNSSGAKKLIRRVREELAFSSFVDIGKLKVFDEVVGYHMIAVYLKDKDVNNNKFIYKKISNNLCDLGEIENTNNLLIKHLKNDNIFTDQEEILVDGEMQIENVVRLGDVCEVSQGEVEASDRVSKKALEKNLVGNIQVGTGIFVLTHKEVNSLQLTKEEMKVLKKYLHPGEVFRYGIKQNNQKYLIYSDKEVKEQIKSNQNFSNLKKHLDNMKVFITSSNGPYGLHRPRSKKYFTREKIIFKNMFKEPEFTYDDTGYFFGLSFSSIIAKDLNYNLKYILALLNSSFALFWYYKNCKKRGAGFDVGVQKIREFPIKKISQEKQRLFIHLVEKILIITKNEDYIDNEQKKLLVRDYIRQIDNLVYKFYNITKDEIEYIERLTTSTSLEPNVAGF